MAQVANTVDNTNNCDVFVFLHQQNVMRLWEKDGNHEVEIKDVAEQVYKAFTLRSS